MRLALGLSQGLVKSELQATACGHCVSSMSEVTTRKGQAKRRQGKPRGIVKVGGKNLLRPSYSPFRLGVVWGGGGRGPQLVLCVGGLEARRQLLAG